LKIINGTQTTLLGHTNFYSRAMKGEYRRN